MASTSVEKAQKFPCFADTYSRKPITDVFTNDTDIDKRGQKRTVPMKVLLLAVGRTGTACKSKHDHHPTSFSPKRENERERERQRD